MKAALTTLLLLAAANTVLEAGPTVLRTEAPETTVRRAIVALRSDDAERRLGAAEALAGLGDPAREAIPVLVGLLGHDPSPRVRAAIAGALEALGAVPPSALGVLRAALGDPVPAVRASAAYALAGVASPEDAPRAALLALARNGPPRVRVAAAFALRRLLPEVAAGELPRRDLARTAWRLLATSLGGPCEETRHLSRALAVLAPDLAARAVPLLVARTQTGDPAVRSGAEAALGELGPRLPALAQALGEALGTDPRPARRRAIGILGWMGPGAAPAVPGLARELEEPDPDLQVAAAEALGRLAATAEPAVVDLQRAVRRESGAVREAAARALISIDPEAAEGTLDALRTVDPDLVLELERELLRSRL